MKRTIAAFVGAFLGMLVAAGADAEAPLNRLVLEAARSYADGGGYKWEGSGVPEAVEHRGEQILAQSAEGTYCSGFTFAVVMKAARGGELLEEQSTEAVRHFQREWYGAVPAPKTREKQCAVAVETLGVGREVSHDEARPGDFAQFWRTNGSGHSVVFLEWVYDEDGKRAGLRYRSSQGATDGIGDHVEYFDGSSAGRGRVDPERLYFARVELKEER